MVHVAEPSKAAAAMRCDQILSRFGSERGPLPIVLGISGHRDIRAGDVEELTEAIRHIFRTLAQRYRNTPLLLLSPLAIGADRIAARVAAEPEFSIPVVAPLPLEQAEYERDFNEDQLSDFRNLLESAHCWYFVGYAPGNDANTVSRDRRARDLQYAQVGSYISRNCQILIALWNGFESAKIGGTAQIVRFKRHGVSEGFGPNRRPLDAVESGLVYQIVTPRESDAVVKGGTTFERVDLGVDDWTDTPDKKSLQSLWLLFTSKIFRLRSHRAPPQELTYLTCRLVDRFNHDVIRNLPSSLAVSAEDIRKAAEALAKRYQKWTLRALNVQFTLAFLTALCFVIYAHGMPTPLWLYGDLACTVLAASLYFAALTYDIKNRHQDYRAIVEGLRIQGFWQKIGIRETVADHYLREYRGELDWIRGAIRTCRLLDRGAEYDGTGDSMQQRSHIVELRRTWIRGTRGQIVYFRDRIAQYDRRQRAWHMCTVVALVASVALTPLLLRWEPQSAHWDGAVIAIAVLAIVGGLGQGYSHMRAYAKQTRTYRRMRIIYHRADKRLREVLAREPCDLSHAQEVFRDLGEEALVEQATWVMLHRERPFEYVRVG